MATFQEIYEQFGRPVYRFLLSLTGSSEESEELLQETFYQAFLHIDRFEGRCSVYTWLCQIGKNAWLKECRRRSRFDRLGMEGMEARAAKGTPEEQFVKKEEYRRIRETIKELEEPYREVFIMHLRGVIKGNRRRPRQGGKLGEGDLPAGQKEGGGSGHGHAVA